MFDVLPAAKLPPLMASLLSASVQFADFKFSFFGVGVGGPAGFLSFLGLLLLPLRLLLPNASRFGPFVSRVSDLGHGPFGCRCSSTCDLD